MSSRLSLKKANIMKRLSIPSISEIKHRAQLLNSLKEEESILPLKKSITTENSILLETLSNKGSSKQISSKNKDSINLKVEELENDNKKKDEELSELKKILEEEKNKVQKLMDTITEKESTIDLLKKDLEKYQKEYKDDKQKNNESNNLIKIDIINKKIEYNLNNENIQLKEELKSVKNENLKLKEELDKNKEKIINLEKNLENEMKQIKKSLNNNNNDNIKKEEKTNYDNKFKEENIICNNEINLNLEEIKNLKNEVTILKEQNEKYVKEIINKDKLINKLNEENISNIKGKDDAEQKLCEINKIHKILQNELEEIKESVKEKEKSENEIINQLNKEAIDAKYKFVDSYYESEVKYMKLKKKFDKLVSLINSHGFKIKEIVK